MSEMAKGLREEMAEMKAQLRGDLADLRRHNEAIAEDLRGEIRVVAEALVAMNVGLDSKLDLFRSEMREQFAALKAEILFYSGVNRKALKPEGDDS